MPNRMILSVRGEQKYYFPSDYVLKSMTSVKIGGYGAIDEVDLVWENGNGVWSNSSSDPGELYNADNSLHHRFEN